MTRRGATREGPENPRGFLGFTHYWSNDTWDRLEESGMEGESFVHDASAFGARGFSGSGVGPGSAVFAVTLFKGTPYLLAAMEVAEIVDRERAARSLGVRPEDLYDAPEHALASERLSTPMRFGRPVPEPALVALRFLRPSDGPGAKGKPPAHARGGHAPGFAIDRQSLRGIRRLTQEAGRALLLAALEEDAPARRGPKNGTREETRSTLEKTGRGTV